MSNDQPPAGYPNAPQPGDPNAYPPPPPPPPAYGQQAYGQPYGQVPGQPPYGYAPQPAGYAHWGLRLAGYLIDGLLVLPGYILAIIGTAISSSDPSGANAAGLVLAVLGYLLMVGVAIWNQWIRQGRTGWSIGKRVMGIRLVREQTGQPLGVALNIGRAFLHVLDALPCYLGFLWPLWDAKKQTFADKIVGSVVVLQKETPQA